MSINWPEVAAGFALGLTPIVMRQIYGAFKFAKLPGRRKYLGVWWVYHRSTTGTGRVYERQWSIRYSWLLNKATIRAFDPKESNHEVNGAPLTYTGKISPRQGMVRYINVRDPASHEEIVWYLFDPFPDPIDKTVGLYLALDLRGLPAAGPMLASRKRLPAKDVDTMLSGDVVRVATLLSTAQVDAANSTTNTPISEHNTSSS